jgi:rod shape-determining protein MreC
MRLLLLLLWRNNFTIVFLLLQGLSFFLLIENNKYQNASILNATNSVVTKTTEGVNYVREYIHLRENNQFLAEENARLRATLKESAYESDTTRTTVNDTVLKQQYTYITAKVINNSINRRNNYLTLNRGSLQGIKPEMGVIASNGIVGIVKQVSQNYCTVMSLLHKDSRISAKIKSNNFFGSLVWNGEDPKIASLNEIDKTVPVKVGDTIVTTSFSSVFPADIIVGVVSSKELRKGSNFHDIRVRLMTRFDNLTYVYVVDNLMKQEQRQLEEQSNTQN